MLRSLVKAMRPVQSAWMQAGILGEKDAKALAEALDTIERYRPLRNDLAHAVVLVQSIGLALVDDDGSTAPLPAETINEAGSALIHAWTVLDDVNSHVEYHLKDKRRQETAII